LLYSPQTKHSKSRSNCYSEASEEAFLTSLDFAINGFAPEVDREVTKKLKSDQLVVKGMPSQAKNGSKHKEIFNFLSIYKAATTQDHLHRFIQAKQLKPAITTTDNVCSNISGSLYEYQVTPSNQSPISKQRRLFSLDSQYVCKKYFCPMGGCTKEYSSKSALNHHSNTKLCLNRCRSSSSKAS
jgi:hypothetical protein